MNMQKSGNDINIGAEAKVAELKHELERSCVFLAQLEASLSGCKVGNATSKPFACNSNHNHLPGVLYESEHDVVGGADTGDQHAILAAERRNIRHISLNGAYPTSEHINNRQKQVPVLVLEFPSEDADAQVSDVSFSSAPLPSGAATSQQRVLPTISIRQRLASQSLKSLSNVSSCVIGTATNTVSGCTGTVSKSLCPTTLTSPPTNSPSEPGTARRLTTVSLSVPSGHELCDSPESTSFRPAPLQQRRQQPLAPSPRPTTAATYRRSISIGMTTIGLAGTTPLRISTTGVGPAGAGCNTASVAIQLPKENTHGGAISGAGRDAGSARAFRHSTSGFTEARCPQLHSCVLEFPTLGMASSPRNATAGIRASMSAEHSAAHQRSSLDLQPLRRYTKTRHSVDVVRPAVDATAAAAAAGAAVVQEAHSLELYTESLSAPLATIPSLNENGLTTGVAAFTSQQTRAHGSRRSRLHGRRGLVTNHHTDMDFYCEGLRPRSRGVSLPGVCSASPAHSTTGSCKSVAGTFGGGVTSGWLGGLKSNGWFDGCDSCIAEGME